MRTMPGYVIGVAAAILVLAAGSVWGGEAAGKEALIAKGRYVFATAGGCGCHTPPDGPGLNAGGQKFDGPFGVVYSRNITPDRETGIGRWTDVQVMNAIRRGERPDGTRLFPIHAYTYFVHIADDETRALVAYLKSVKPVKHAVPARNLKGPAPAIPVPESPKAAPTAGVARGEYLVKGPSHCGDCHTPHRPGGGQDLSKFLAGGPGPEGTTPPNITPHPVTGIGQWTEEQIVQSIIAGTRPNGTALGSLMRVVIQGTSGGYKDMRREDARAIAQYLKTVPPIDNKVP